MSEPTPVPMVTVRRKAGASRVRSVAGASAEFVAGDGDGPWTLPASDWAALPGAADAFEIAPDPPKRAPRAQE